MHRQVCGMYGAMCRVDDCNGIPHEMQSYDYACLFPHYDAVFSKCVVSNFKLIVAVAMDFSDWPFAACFRKLGRPSILRILSRISVLLCPTTPEQLH